jgi:hypothetical protein
MPEFENKPTVHLVGEDGNVFSLLGICTKALRRSGNHEMAKRLTDRVFGAGSYDEALSIMGEYVDIEA